MTMKVCVTGSTGFVGKALTRKLQGEQHAVVRVTRNPGFDSDVAVGDIGSDTDWTQAVAGCDVVVHLAARVHVMHETALDPYAIFNAINVVATLNLVRAASVAGVKRFVFVSSVKVNGEFTQPDRPFTEADLPAPKDAYGRSKLAAEKGIQILAAESGMEWVIIRPPLVYGPGVKANFAALINTAKRGWPLPLGAIQNQRSLVALDNLVDFIACCVSHPLAANQVFLVSDGGDVSTPELVKKMAKAYGKTLFLPPVPVVLLKAVAGILGKVATIERLSENLQVDISKARHTLGWRPVIGVDEGLTRAAHNIDKL
jgi:nucleoside-diphosphate-sugar epimerase